MSNKIFTSTLALSLSLFGLSGCYPFLYHAPLKQGNVINPDQVAQLKIGMTKEQVTSIMGTPILETPLTPDMWHYIFTNRIQGKQVDQKQVTLYFNRNKLTRIA